MRSEYEMERAVASYSDMVRRICFLHLKNRHDTEDVFQNVFLKYLLYEGHFADYEHEKAWMIRTAMNLAKDLLKSKWHKTTVGIEEAVSEEKGYFQIPGMETDDTLWVLLELPQKYKECLYLFYYEDFSVREIAGVLEKSENTVKTNLRRGRELLKQKLKERV